LCLLNASFEKIFHNTATQLFTPKSMTLASAGAIRGKLFARWRRSVASRVALDLPYWEMGSASYRLTRMAFEMAREAGYFFSFVKFMSGITIAK